MKNRAYAFLLSVSLFSLCMIMSACSSSITNTSAATSGSIQGLTQVAQSSVSDTKQNASVASAKGNSYAFVRSEQLWVALNRTKPVQVTHFDYSSVGGAHANVFWNQPLWFDSDRYVAFELKALLGGLGGGGCGYIGDDGRSGSLYVLNTTTMQITRITVPGEKDLGVDHRYDGYWEYLFTEDTTHLLAWHRAEGNAGGLYRYDFKTRALSLALPASSVPAADSNGEAFSPMRYSSGKLYYEVMNNVSGSLYDHVIYSHSVAHPDQPTVKVLDVGTQVFCDMEHGNTGLFREPGWDISPDGQYMAVQKIVKSKQGKETSAIQSISLKNGVVTPLFSQLATSVLSHDLVLSWAPDSQTLLLQSPLQTPGQGTFYSITKSSIVYTYPYMTNFGYHVGHIFWKSNSTTFAFYAFQEYDTTAISSTYTFTIGKTQGQVLLSNATNFAWG